jgi:PAS domain-containing protein
VLVHKLFAKQLAKVRLASGATDIDALGALVSAAYEEADRDRRRTDRSIALMTEEVDQLNRGLECLVNERTAELQSVRSVLEAALNNMSQGLLMFDAQARLVICNRRYMEMYALDPQAVQPGCHLRDLLRLRAANGTFSGDPERYIEKLLQRIAIKNPETLLVELRTAARWPSSTIRRPMAAGLQRTRTSPSGGVPRSRFSTWRGMMH